MSAQNTSMPRMYVRADYPGVIRFEGADEWSGIIAGLQAANIVRACNAHDELVAALRECVAELEAYEAPSNPLDSHIVRVVQARAALAKAGAE